MKFLITDAEWDALFDEPADVFKTYCAIRRVMDYGTGVAGISHMISERMIKEAIEVPAVRGRHKTYRPTRQQVRQPIQRLIALGLLVPLDRPMVYRLPYAAADNSAPRMNNRWSTNEQPHEQPEKQHKKQDTYDTSATASSHDDVLMNNPHPVSGIREDSGTNVPDEIGEIFTSSDQSETDVKTAAKTSAWAIGVQMLTPHCKTQKQARSYIGSLCKQYGEAATIAGINYTAIHNPANPIEYLRAMLQKREQQNRPYSAGAATAKAAFAGNGKIIKGQFCD